MEQTKISMTDIVEYLRNMSFKTKPFGGCDKEDVLDKIEELTRMYQRILNDMAQEVEQLKGEREARQEQLKQELSEMLTRAQHEANQIRVKAEADAQAHVDERKAEVDQLRKECGELIAQKAQVKKNWDNELLDQKVLLRVIGEELGSMMTAVGALGEKLEGQAAEKSEHEA
ncbi:MAG: hypothetical protein FWE69_03210 [Clostridiales bacterium]|nr:hypothetical protein [Clostridiales bacterium]